MSLDIVIMISMTFATIADEGFVIYLVLISNLAIVIEGGE